MKKIICALLVGMTLFSFTACSEDKTSENEAGTESAVSENSEVVSAEQSSDGYIHMTDMVGKKFSELLENGYEYYGYEYSGDEGTSAEPIIFVSAKNADDDTLAKIAKLEGKTISELADMDLFISYEGYEGDYTFGTRLGSVEVYFDLDIDNAGEILDKNFEADPFVEVSDIKELKDVSIKNPRLNFIEYNITFEENPGDLSEVDDVELFVEDYIIKDIYYIPITEI